MKSFCKGVSSYVRRKSAYSLISMALCTLFKINIVINYVSILHKITALETIMIVNKDTLCQNYILIFYCRLFNKS